MRRRNREMLQWIRRVLAPYALVVPGGRLEARLPFFLPLCVCKPVFAEGRCSRVLVADLVMDADLDSAAGMTALWRFLGDGVALFCIAHR